MDISVFDFDGTIYKGDSTIDFFLYSLYKKPFLIRYLPKQIKGFILYLTRRISKTQFKEYFFCFLSGIDCEKMVNDFWASNERKIYEWYLVQKNENDIIISASPEFLLRPICERLGIENLIASQVDELTGIFERENCFGEEKIVRLKEEYKMEKIDRFYSDSENDLPLAKIAEHPYRIKNGEVIKWII